MEEGRETETKGEVNSGGAAAEMKQTIWLRVEFKTSPLFLHKAESIF